MLLERATLTLGGNTTRLARKQVLLLSRPFVYQRMLEIHLVLWGMVCIAQFDIATGILPLNLKSHTVTPVRANQYAWQASAVDCADVDRVSNSSVQWARDSPGLRWLLSALNGNFEAVEALMNVEFFQEQRRQMVAAIRAISDHIAAQIGKSTLDDQVLQAIAKVPRHEFVPVEIQQYAYLNRPFTLHRGGRIPDWTRSK
jgi:hypothetical protein